MANPQAAIIKAVIKLLTKQFKLDSLGKIFKYVEEDNELDVGLRKLESQQDALKNMVVEMARDSHQPQPFAERIEKLEEFQKKMQNTKAFKKLIHKL